MPRLSSRTHQLRWEALIRKQQESGLSVARGCRENQIVPSTFHYWKGKLQLLTRNNFLELAHEKTPIAIECNHFRIRVEHGFDPDILKQCLVLLRQVC